MTRIVLFLLACGWLHGQDFQRHTVTAALIGYIRPVQRAIGTGNRVGVGAAYGFRAHCNLQFDLGLDVIPGPVGGDFCCRFADSGDDWLYLIPAGARFVVPTRADRLLLSIGGGLLAAHYRLGNVVFVGLPASRTEWGGYGLASGSYAITGSGHWRIGGTIRYDAAGSHRDVVVRGEFSYGF